jgi:predicted small metal-binding protein
MTAKIIECPCGAVIDGEGDDDVIGRAQDHARSTHGMDLSREQALSMARPA